MKKTYINPAVSVVCTEQTLLVSASAPTIRMSDETVDAADLDVKGADDWGDIWDDSSFDE